MFANNPFKSVDQWARALATEQKGTDAARRDFNPIHSIDPRLQHHLRLSSFNFKQMQTTWSYENLSPLNIIKWTFGSPQVMCFHVLLLNRELDVWAKIWKVNVPKVHEKWNAYERQENIGETTI